MDWHSETRVEDEEDAENGDGGEKQAKTNEPIRSPRSGWQMTDSINACACEAENEKTGVERRGRKCTSLPPARSWPSTGSRSPSESVFTHIGDGTSLMGLCHDGSYVSQLQGTLNTMYISWRR